jgi:hypothetical protein
LAAIFGVLALQDRRAPTVAVVAAPIDDQALSERTFGIRFGCARNVISSNRGWLTGPNASPRTETS